MKKKASVHNLGCKVNAYETEAMQQLLTAAGYEIVPFAPGADVYVINTCSVTNIADRKSRQMLHKAKKMNPNAIVIAAGCYVQTDKETLEADPAIDIILGNNKKKRIVEVIENYRSKHTDEDITDNIFDEREFETLSIDSTAEHVRAYIKVQDGCNQFCTYCIIPYARGRVRSRRAVDICEEIRTLARKGYKEMVLTGIHLSSYGIDFKDDENTDLLALIRKVNEIEGVERIRLGSLEPRVITEEFVQAIAAMPKFCPHFHLSLQSGCDTTLERMNRRYDAAEYREKCELLRKYFEAPAITTDVIVGFPGEDEKEFEESFSFVKEIRFYETHIFPYSRRKGTKAAVMEHQVAEPVKKERSEKMLSLDRQRRQEYENAFLGKELQVLIEEETVYDGKTYYVGHSMEYIKTVVEKQEGIAVNDIVTVQAEKNFRPGILTGSIRF